MPNRTVSIADIKSNPFQSRKSVDPGAVERLAKEIKETGYWGGTLRVRQQNGHYELVFGHQRLRALKQLGHKAVSVEVADLSDVEMAQQSLIENLQRHNLLEIDKAEAIQRAFEMEKANNGSVTTDRAIIQRLALLLGYNNEQTLRDFLGMASLTDDTKKVVREHNMPRGAVQTARGIGGEAMVKHAAKHRISELDLKPMRKIVTSLPEPVRQKVVEAVVKDRLTTPEQVEKVARREQAKTVKKDEIPPDLMLFIRKWTADLMVWQRKLNAARKHKVYIHAHPEVATKFKDAAEAFMAELKELLDL
jgi:ParB family chromosome partitioning protein